MIKSPIELAEHMGIELHNIMNVWSLFQLNREKPFDNEYVTKMLSKLSIKEKEFLMFLGLNAISTEMDKRGGVGNG